MIEDYSFRFCKLESIISEGMIKNKDTWYRYPKKIEYIIKDFSENLLLDDSSNIEIEFKGENLIKIMEGCK